MRENAKEIFVLLRKEDGLSNMEIAMRLNKNARNISTYTKELLKYGLIRKEKHGRENQIYLTKLGKETSVEKIEGKVKLEPTSKIMMTEEERLKAIQPEFRKKVKELMTESEMKELMASKASKAKPKPKTKKPKPDTFKVVLNGFEWNNRTEIKMALREMFCLAMSGSQKAKLIKVYGDASKARAVFGSLVEAL